MGEISCLHAFVVQIHARDETCLLFAKTPNGGDLLIFGVETEGTFIFMENRKQMWDILSGFQKDV